MTKHATGLIQIPALWWNPEAYLLAPYQYWFLPPEEHERICNGMGPKGWGWAVPDTMWGLPVGESGDIHDAMYYWAETVFARRIADMVLLVNLTLTVLRGSTWQWVARLRQIRVMTYFRAVWRFGSKFWEVPHERTT